MARTERPIKIGEETYKSIGDYITTKHKLIKFNSKEWVNMFSKIYKRAKSEKCTTVNFLGEAPKAKAKSAKPETKPEPKPENFKRVSADNVEKPIKVKTCNRCKEPQALDNFYKDKCAKDGHAGICKDCKKKKKAK